MKEILRTTDPVELSWVTALMSDAGIETAILDSHMSILEGSIGILPRRVVVADEDYDAALRLLGDSDQTPG